MACPPGSDGQFGPRVDTSCRAFDFTLAFEDIVFVCLPAAIFLLFAPGTLFVHWKSKYVASQRPRLLAAKLIAFACLFAANIAALALRVGHNPTRGHTELAAGVLLLVSILVATLLSAWSNGRSSRPSTLLILYFSAVLLLSIPRVRTFWLIEEAHGVAICLTLALCFTALIVFLESAEIRATDPTDNTEKRAAHGDQHSSFWNRTIFAWLAPTFWLGFTTILSQHGLPPLGDRLSSQAAHSVLLSTWNKYNRRRKHTLAFACFRAFLPTFVSGVVPRLCLTLFTFSQPFLLADLINYITAAQPQTEYGRGLIGAWVLAFLGIAISTSVYQYQTTRLVTKIRGALAGLVYHQTLHLKASETGEVTAVSLLGVDIERIESGLNLIHEVWASLLEIGIATWLLEKEVSLACLAPVVLVIVFLAATSRFAPLANTTQQKWIGKVQHRTQVTSSLLDNITTVKMLGLSGSFGKLIEKARADEIQTSKGYRKVLISIILLSNTPIILAPTVTFAVYVLISVFWTNTSLEIAQAFKALVFISLLAMPVVIFVQALPNVVQTLGNFGRIQEYCTFDLAHKDAVEADELREVNPSGRKRLGEELMPYPGTSTATVGWENNISFNAASFRWEPTGPVILDRLSTSVQSGKITVVVGPVGSGKSSFLNSIMGEMSGPSQRHRSQIAYCSQQPWLESKSIRDTIVGQNSFDKTWYAQVVGACDLRQDLAQLDKGEETNLSSRGLNLSGGQRQRIALARALYSKSPIVLLDDVFSGMDANTVETVSQRLFGQRGILRDPFYTVVVTTHNRKVMSLADNAIVLDKGKIIESGSTVSVLRANDDTLGVSIDEQNEQSHTVEKDKDGVLETAEHEQLDLQRKTGDLSVYKYYVKCSGYLSFASYATFVTIWMFFTQFSTIWLMWWSDSNSRSPNDRVGMYIGVYVTFGILGTISACLTAWFEFISMISKSGKDLHSDLLWATIRAPSWFFSTTDAGEILNRFSQDMELIDMELPTVAGNFLSSAVSCAMEFVIIIVFSRYLSAAIPILGLLLYYLQKFYLKTSRQIRLLAIEAKAPLYSTFTETVAGAVTIRAFGWDAKYKERVYELIDRSQQAKYALSCVQHWLAFVLDMITTGFVAVLVATIVTWRDKFEAGWVAVSVYMVIGFSSTLARVVKNWTAMESSVGAVARVKRFVDSTPAENQELKAHDLPAWPTKGFIQFSNLDASHQPNTPLVLKQVSFSVEPGQRVAICGRSGSGKTSLILSLLGLTNIDNGSITIDDMDVSTLHSDELRQRLNCVPQHAIVLPGTIRFNLDPSAAVSEALLLAAIRRVGLESVVESQGGLDAEINIEAWSAGQRQLLSFARALLRQRAVLILDEAMSNLDGEKEKMMHEVVMNDFQGATVLTVMHRLKHALDYDKVAVMGEGRLVEYGSPLELSRTPGSLFAKLYSRDVVDGQRETGEQAT